MPVKDKWQQKTPRCAAALMTFTLRHTTYLTSIEENISSMKDRAGWNMTTPASVSSIRRALKT